MSVFPKVHFIHPALQKLLPQYRLIRDALAGEVAVKARKMTYLPHPGEPNKCGGVDKRYEDYITRANYYNITRRTLNGLVGQVFMKDPVVKLPGELSFIEEDVTGTKIPLLQQAKKVEALTLSYSRCGLFVDYPAVEGPVTKEQLEKEKIRPTIKTYHAEEIVNWHVIQKGGVGVLSMVALYETYEFENDGFEAKTAEQYRVLRIDSEGNYYQDIWREREPTEKKKTDPFDMRRETGRTGFEPTWQVHQTVYPTDANGQPFKEIPFTFIGSENNDHNPDNPNLFDLASLNIAHYRNSADYEELLFLSGQPTIFISGMTKEYLDEVHGGILKMGSRGGVTGPENSSAKLLQISENQPGLAAMEHKEKQMVALGAKLVEQNKVERTAFEVRLEATADGSVLSNTTKNVSSAFVQALKWCAMYVGTTGEIEFKLNTEYDLVKMNSDEIQQLILTWQEGLLGFKEVRDKLRQDNIATMPDEAVKSEYDERKEKEIEMQRDQFAAEQQGQENNAQKGNQERKTEE